MGLFAKFFSKKLDALTAEELSDVLVGADVAPEISAGIVKRIRQSQNPRETLREGLLEYAGRLQAPQFFVPNAGLSILIVGVNGAGKTTAIGKLAKRFADAGRHVVIGACDTFRAAANEQLDVWAKCAGAEIVHGAEPASVAFKTIENSAGKVAILDTAGRLHNRGDLMDELSKIVRVVKKLDVDAPTETWLALDGTTGQNALAQIEYFNRATPLTGLIITKMDGTSKGGFLITYAAREKNPLPVRYVGYGEKIDNLRPFDAGEYVEKLIS
jgi:fused signal recognition particle receptor